MTDTTVEYKKWNALKHTTPILLVFIFTGTVKAWVSGDVTAWTWRWYHPFTWLLAPGFLVLYFVIAAFADSGADLSDAGVTLDKYWKQRKNERVFFKPFDVFLARVPKHTMKLRMYRHER